LSLFFFFFFVHLKKKNVGWDADVELLLLLLLLQPPLFFAAAFSHFTNIFHIRQQIYLFLLFLRVYSPFLKKTKTKKQSTIDLFLNLRFILRDTLNF
jgi:hypothetical protein